MTLPSVIHEPDGVANELVKRPRHRLICAVGSLFLGPGPDPQDRDRVVRQIVIVFVGAARSEAHRACDRLAAFTSSSKRIWRGCVNDHLQVLGGRSESRCATFVPMVRPPTFGIAISRPSVAACTGRGMGASFASDKCVRVVW